MAYDGLLKIWDVREEIPLYTISSHKDKLFEAAWIDDERLVSGGSDSKYIIHACDFKSSS